MRNGFKPNERLFPITEREVQKQLKTVCDYLGYEGIGTHSFRELYATEICRNNGHDIALVQTLQSTAVLPLREDISALSLNALKRRLRGIRL